MSFLYFQNSAWSGRGFFIAANTDDAGDSKCARFLLGARMVESDKVPAIQKAASILKDTIQYMTLECHTGMRFCPWCGRDLSKFYRKTC